MLKYVIPYLSSLVILAIPLLTVAQLTDSLYWADHIQPLDLTDDSLFASFEMLDSVVQDYQFFFTAEQHWKTINTKIQFAFLTYLHQKANVRNLILEGGYAYGFLINRFLQTGDKLLLKKALNNIPVCPDDQEQMFELLYEYNQKLPDSQRIQTTGIDLEHSPELALQAIHTLLPQHQPPRQIAKNISRIKDLHQSRYYDKREVKRFFKRLEKDLNRKRSHYQTYWGKDLGRLELLVENSLHGFQFNLLKALIFKDSWQKREERMYNNFLTLTPYMKAGNFYAQFGALHTDISRSRSWEFPSLAHRLNYFRSSPVSNSVLTISRYLRKMQDQYEVLGDEEALSSMVRHIEQRFPEHVVLCNLIGVGSPFQELSQNFQFLLLIDEEMERQSCD
ncbi:MAG: hypothetical protein AAF587_01830 [Bacteroidota bacterium]